MSESGNRWEPDDPSDVPSDVPTDARASASPVEDPASMAVAPTSVGEEPTSMAGSITDPTTGQMTGDAGDPQALTDPADVDPAYAGAGTPTTTRRRRIPSGTTFKLVVAGLVLFLAGGAGGYALAIARTPSSQIVPANFQIRQGFRGFGDDGGGGLGQSNPFANPFGQSNPNGQSNPFGSGGSTGGSPQGTTA